MGNEHCAWSASHDKDEAGERSEADLPSQMAMIGDLIWVKLSNGSWWPSVVVGDEHAPISMKPARISSHDILVRIYGSHEFLYIDPLKCYSEFSIILKQNNGCIIDIFMKTLEKELHLSKRSRVAGQASKSKGKSNRNIDGTKAQKSVSVKVIKDGEFPKLKRKQSYSSMVGLKSKHGEQDGVGEKMKLSNTEPNGSNTVTMEGIKRRTQGTRRRKKQDGPGAAAAEKSKNAAPEQIKGTSSMLVRSRERSARRTRVMLTLGLIAPRGSPFCRRRSVAAL